MCEGVTQGVKMNVVKKKVGIPVVGFDPTSSGV